jgi:SAM-dependent methyltransferase
MLSLTAIPSSEREAWLDALWDIDGLPPDEPNLPRGCVPYLPCSVATVLDAVEQAGVTSGDVFVDVGSGAGRAALLVHLATGADCVGLELQPELVRASQARAERLGFRRLRFLEGDAAELIRSVPPGTVYFLYCPFGGERLERFLDGLEEVARARPIRVCCVDMPPLARPWLVRRPPRSSNLDVYDGMKS